ncbi:hypothetical protein D3C85_1250400 [compost metagenome]
MIVRAIRPRVNTISTLIVGHFEPETVTHEGKGRVKVYDRKNNMLNDFWPCAQTPFTMLIEPVYLAWRVQWIRCSHYVLFLEKTKPHRQAAICQEVRCAVRIQDDISVCSEACN